MMRVLKCLGLAILFSFPRIAFAQEVENSEYELTQFIQPSLKALGLYGGVVDGKIGPGTKKAIIDFEKRSSYYVKDGFLNEFEMRMLMTAAGRSPDEIVYADLCQNSSLAMDSKKSSAAGCSQDAKEEKSVTGSNRSAQDYSTKVTREAPKTPPDFSAGSAKTSVDVRNTRFCDAMANADLATLTYPQTYLRLQPDPQFIPKKDIKFDIVYAFADIGGDGIHDLVSHLTSFEEPRTAMPIFTWSEKWKANGIEVGDTSPGGDGVDPYGTGAHYGLKPTSVEVTRILVDDLNGDNIDDLVFVDYGEHSNKFRKLMGGTISVALSSKSGRQYSIQKLDVPKNTWHGGVTVDVDGDGDKDIVIAGGAGPRNEGGPWVFVIENLGGGKFSAGKPFLKGKSDGVYMVTGGDIDEDGFPDIVTGSTSPKAGNEQLKIYWGGSNYKTYSALDLNLGRNDGILDANISDINGDGNKDLVIVSPIDDYKKTRIILVEMQGRVPSQARVIGDFGQYDIMKTDGKFPDRDEQYQPSDVAVCDGAIYGFYNVVGRFRLDGARFVKIGAWQ
jgi:hypothetical protein